MVKFQWIKLGGSLDGSTWVSRVPGGIVIQDNDVRGAAMAFVPCPPAEAEEFIEFNRAPKESADAPAD